MSENVDPKIYLGIDNCFAIKRWTSPMEWGRVVREMGLQYIEAVPDLECEPLLTPPDYRKDWIHDVNRMKAELGIDVVMSYSNNSTYDTIGFSHPDERIRNYLVDKWFANFINVAASIGSDLGYYVQATPENMLFDKEARRLAKKTAFDCMVRINKIAGEKGIRHIALEQMYTPHQPPFTIAEMKKLILDVTRVSGFPFYFTEDVGHHCVSYLRPDEDSLQRACKRYREDGYIEIWLGSLEAIAIFKSGALRGELSNSEISSLMEDFELNSDQFSGKKDTDCYSWLSEIGAWSPVIHMQQTDGNHSSHLPFLPANNTKGIINPLTVLEKLHECYARPSEEGFPPKCDNIYFIQEIYFSTKDIGYQVLHDLKASTDYLRRFIPHDGMRLSELLCLNGIGK